MKAAVLAVLALFFVCAFAQDNSAECERIRYNIRNLRDNPVPGQLEANLAKRSEYKLRLAALGCPLETKVRTRDNERPECKDIRQKFFDERSKLGENGTSPVLTELQRQLDANRCAKRARTPAERRNEDPKCDEIRRNIRQLRATTGDADKDARDRKENDWKEQLQRLKCVEIKKRNPRNNTKENPECKNIRKQIGDARKNVTNGTRAEVEQKVNEWKLKLAALNCTQRSTVARNRTTEDPKCKDLRAQLRTVRLGSTDKYEMRQKEENITRALDALKCAKRRRTPVERKNEDPECEATRAKIRAIRAQSPNATDKAAVDTKVEEYKNRLKQLKCVRLRDERPARGRCYVTGNFKELCTDRVGAIGELTYKAEFKCYKDARCGVYGKNRSCAWEKTPELYRCLNDRTGSTSTTQSSTTQATTPKTL